MAPSSTVTERSRLRRYLARLTAGRVVWGFVLLLVVIAFILPFLWIISTSLRLPKDSFSLPPSFFPTSFDFQNYVYVFKSMPFGMFFLNSVKVSVFATLGQALVSSMAGYGFARIRFPGRNVLFLLTLSGLMISDQVTVIPQFIMMAKFHLIDSNWTLVILWLINPLGIFLIRQFMLSIPNSYEEAAFMDGANRWWVFLRVMLPMARPAVAVSAVTWFVLNWNDFFRPLIFINTWSKMTLPLGMTVLKGTFGTGNLSAVLAGVALSLLPALVFFIFGQRYLLEGLTVGGLK